MGVHQQFPKTLVIENPPRSDAALSDVPTRRTDRTLTAPTKSPTPTESAATLAAAH
jgi:hypothetical protein